jgi:hypothetical protein
MVKYLRYFEIDFDITIKENKEWHDVFGAMPQVCPMFEYEFGKCLSENIKKLVVTFTINETCHLKQQLLNDILIVYYYVNMTDLLQCGGFEQKKMLLDAIFSCFVKYADKYGWNKEQGLITYKKILDKEIQFEQYIGGCTVNKKNRNKAQCYFSFTQKIDLFLCVRQKDSETEQRLLITQMSGGWYFFAQIFGKLFWKDDETVILEWRNKQACWEINIRHNTVQFKHYKFYENSDNPHYLYQLACLYLNEIYFLPNTEKAFQLLNKSAKLGNKHAKNKIQFLKNSNEI